MELSFSVFGLNRKREETVGKKQNQRQAKIKIVTSKIDLIKTPEGERICSERVVSSCFLLVKSDKNLIDILSFATYYLRK